jgi:uncharacterized protein (DUF488 family)
MNTIMINGVLRPFKKTNRALRRLEAKGIDITGGTNQISLMINLAYEMVKEGHLISKDPNKGKWSMTMDQFESYDAEEDFIQEITERGLDDEKKQDSFSQVSGEKVVTQSIKEEAVVKAIQQNS